MTLISDFWFLVCSYEEWKDLNGPGNGIYFGKDIRQTKTSQVVAGILADYEGIGFKYPGRNAIRLLDRDYWRHQSF